MKNFEETIKDEIIAYQLVNDDFEIINECSIFVDGIEVFQVQPESVAAEVLEDFKNYDGFKAHSFNYMGETFYFVKQ